MCFTVFKSCKTKKSVFKNVVCTKASDIKFNIYIFSWLKFNGKKFNRKIQCQRFQGQLMDTKRKAIDSAASQTEKRLYAPNYSGVWWMAHSLPSAYFVKQNGINGTIYFDSWASHWFIVIYDLCGEDYLMTWVQNVLKLPFKTGSRYSSQATIVATAVGDGRTVSAKLCFGFHFPPNPKRQRREEDIRRELKTAQRKQSGCFANTLNSEEDCNNRGVITVHPLLDLPRFTVNDVRRLAQMCPETSEFEVLLFSRCSFKFSSDIRLSFLDSVERGS